MFIDKLIEQEHIVNIAKSEVSVVGTIYVFGGTAAEFFHESYVSTARRALRYRVLYLRTGNVVFDRGLVK